MIKKQLFILLFLINVCNLSIFASNNSQGIITLSELQESIINTLEKSKELSNEMQEPLREYLAINTNYFNNIDKYNAYFINFSGKNINNFNELKDMVLQYTIPLENIVSLNLARNNFTEIKDEDIKSFYNLQVLDISDNQIENVGTNVFLNSKVNNLFLSHNKIKHLLFLGGIVEQQKNFIVEFQQNEISATEERLMLYSVGSTLKTIKGIITYKDCTMMRLVNSSVSLKEKYKTAIATIIKNGPHHGNIFDPEEIVILPLSETFYVTFKNIRGFFHEKFGVPYISEFDILLLKHILDCANKNQ